MVITAAAINVGFEAMLFWVFANTIAIQRDLLPCHTQFDRLRRALPLERGLGLGAALILLGLVSFTGAVSEWLSVGFGPLVGGKAMRLVIVSGTTFVLGTQLLFGSFFLYVLENGIDVPGRKPFLQSASNCRSRPAATKC